MTKEDLITYKKQIAELSEKEKELRRLELRRLASGELQGPPVGYASIDQLWLGKYPEMVFQLKNPCKRLNDAVGLPFQEHETMIHYYGSDISKKELFERVDLIAKSLDSYGIKKGDTIMTSLESVPEFLELLLACEKIGCSIKNFVGTKDETIELINKDQSTKLYICADYTSKDIVQGIKEKTQIKNIISISPLSSTKREKVREKILEEIDSRYTDQSVSNTNETITWENFLENGRQNPNEIVENTDNNVKLYSCYTSGTTGMPKEVLHSSETMLGVIKQMALFPNRSEQKEKWLLTILPPTLVAVVVAMTCQPLASGKKIILDPYCRVEDLDLEMMHYEPNDWPLIPVFFDSLIESKRIPEDYDMSYFKMIGFGAEAVTAKFVRKSQAFLTKHKCQAPITSGYGQSEGGSDFTIAIGEEMLAAASSGMPLIDTVIAVFEPKTSTELPYYQIGEICKTGPGLMLGYSDPELTKEVLIEHEDGTVWLHTGDYGFVDTNGLLFTLGRDKIKKFPEGEAYGLNIENKMCTMPGVKEAIVVVGTDEEHEGYNKIYLFLIPNSEDDKELILESLPQYMNENLLPNEMPNGVHIIDKKPISKFKTDRKILKKNYHIQ